MFRKMFLLGLLLALFSCSENSSDTEDNPSIQIISSINSDYYNASSIKTGNIASDDIDSLKITEMNVLISRIILHNNNEDYSLNEKSGPFVIKANYDSNYYEVVSSEIPEGEYDQIKLEMHRFSASEISNWSNNEDFGVFATPERYSVIIKGIIYNNGNSEDFTYNATVTANLNLNFGNTFSLTDKDILFVDVEFDPNSLFYDKNSFIDPRDDGNHNKIDNNIKSAFRAIPEMY